MTIEQLIAAKRGEIAVLMGERSKNVAELATLRGKEEATDEDQTRVETLRTRNTEIDTEVRALEVKISEYEAERAADQAADAKAEATRDAAPSPSEHRGAARVTSEPRTYSRETDPKGVSFLQDIGAAFMGNNEAGQRLARHMQEERVERGDQLTSRAVTTSAFSGLVVPQYLTDLVAPQAKAGRPFADACRSHDLPSKGMVVNISKITTGTSADIQAAQGDTVSETDIDDTLLSVNVQTNAGSQSISRQALERGEGIESTTLDDLFRAYNTKLDNTLLNQSSTGLTNVATSIAYTDASPTAAELYPKMLAGPAAVEAALLDMDPNDVIAVMHSRRWYWLQSQLSSTWPLFGQPGVGQQQGGVNYGERYGSGFRGLLPNGVAVVVDNNIVTNLGAGTNEDEVYFVAQSEAHLWEDPNAPMLIKAEQNQAKKLLVDFVVYGYFAYTFTRRAHAQKIAGTGLVTPTF